MNGILYSEEGERLVRELYMCFVFSFKKYFINNKWRFILILEFYNGILNLMIAPSILGGSPQLV